MISPSGPEQKGTPPERELAEAFKRGEPGAYEAIYERFETRVSGVCRRMLGDHHDAQEATQETFLRVYQALPRFNGRYQLGAWISRISTNVCLDTLRSRTRKPTIPSTMEELEFELGEFATDPETPEDFAMRRAESRHVRRVLASLPPLHRAAIILRDFEGHTYEEVAIALGITDVQCKALIHRARQNFKRTWTPASVAALLPFRFFARFRKLDASDVGDKGHQVARTGTQLADVAASATQTVTACSTFLQTCGAVVSERLVGAAATVAIAAGSFAVGTSVGRMPSANQAELTAPGASVEEKHLRPASKQFDASSLTKRGDRRATVHDYESPAPEKSTGPTDPAPVPASSPTPTPSEEPTGGGGSSATPPKAPQPTPSTSVPRSAITVGFSGEGSAPTSVPQGASSLDCSARALNQTLSVPFHTQDGDRSSLLQLQLGTGANLYLEIEHEGSTYTYNGGASSVTWEGSGRSTRARFHGSYSLVGDSRPDSANLSRYGSFTGSVSLDCNAGHVITEVIEFSR